MKCPYCGRKILLTPAIRSGIKHGNVIRWCPDCNNKVNITGKDIAEADKLAELSRYEQRIQEGLCGVCGIYPPAEGKKSCDRCLAKGRERRQNEKQRDKQLPQGFEEKKKTAQMLPRNKPETLDDICRKARKHNLSYGKYLAKRAQGMYLDE